MSTLEKKGASGRIVTYTAPTGGVSSDDLVTLASGTDGWVGVARDDIAATEDGPVEVGAQMKLPKNTGTGESFSVGDKVYKDNSTGDATPSSTGNHYIGRCSEAATTSDTHVWTMMAEAGGGA